MRNAGTLETDWEPSTSASMTGYKVKEVPFSGVDEDVSVNSERLVAFPIWWVQEKGNTRSIKRPVHIEIVNEADGVQLKNENLGLFAFGQDVQEALRDFNDQLVYFINHYSNIQAGALLGDAVRLQALFKSLA